MADRRAALAVVAIAISVAIASGAWRALYAQSPVSIFGTRLIRHYDLGQFTKWTGALHWSRRHLAETWTAEAAARRPTEARWRDLLASLRGQDRRQQMEAVNSFINDIPLVTDLQNWGVDDYWATPREFFLRGGDCEDYALAKYISLRELGWPATDLALVVVEIAGQRVPHAVLIANVDGTRYILDNLSSSTDQARAAQAYRPIYSINEQAWWRHVPIRPHRTVAANSRG